METTTVIAIIDANQANLEAGYSTPQRVEAVKTLITAIEATEKVDIIVVSTDNEVVNQAALDLGAVNRLESSQLQPHALLASVIDSEESFVDEEAWVLYVNAQVADQDFNEVIRRAFTALSVNPAASGVRAVGIGDAEMLHLFRAGNFDASQPLPVSGTIDYLAN